MLTIDCDRLGVAAGDVVLDLGCGKGRHSYEIQRRGGDPIAVDLDMDSLVETAAMMKAVAVEDRVAPGSCAAGDALDLPFADATFDHVIASEVLEHIPSDVLALREIARVLKPNGRAAISVPRFWPEAVCWALSSEYHSNAGGHVRIYRPSQLLKRAAEAGFHPYTSHHAHAFHSPYWWLRCMLDLDGKKAPVSTYHRFLVWDIENPNRVVRSLERSLDPLLGKSFVVYLRKAGADVAVS